MKALLEELTREARAQADETDSDPRWRALAEGTLSEEEHQGLIELAKSSEDARLKYEMLAPISAQRRAAMTDRALDARSGAGETTGVHSLRARRRRFAAVGVALALAASIAVVVVTRPKPSSAALPRYELELRAGTQERRSPRDAINRDPESVDLEPDMPFELTLRPEHSVAGGVAFLGYVVREGRATEWEPAFKSAATGVIRIRGKVRDVFAKMDGELRVIAIVASKAAIDEVRARVAQGDDPDRIADSSGVRVLKVHATIRRAN